MRVLFLTDGPQIPSGRFRVEQFLPALRERGVEPTVRYAYGTGYNDVLGKPWERAYKAGCRLRRAAHTLLPGSFDLVFLQRTALAVSAIPEVLRARYGVPMVFDFDDAIFLGPGGRRSHLRAVAFRQAVAASSQVIAGNRFLAEQANAPEKTSVIPTVVDTSRYVPRGSAAPREERLIVGWMGTSSNFPSLRLVMPEVVAAVSTVPRARVRIVSNRRMPEWEGHPLVEQVAWKKEDEIRLLQSFDIGLMPLENTPLTWGKCGFKMIQYMAVGVPVLASAVGANVDIFNGSGAGFLMRPGESWLAPLVQLLGDPELRRATGSAGRTHALHSFGLDAVVGRLYEVMRRAVTTPARMAA